MLGSFLQCKLLKVTVPGVCSEESLVARLFLRRKLSHLIDIIVHLSVR
jgi:hypothetical protein